MIRTTGLASAWLAVVCAAWLAVGQEPAKDRNSLRIEAQQALERFAPDTRIAVPRSGSPPAVTREQPSQADRRARDTTSGRTRVVRQPVAARDSSLSAFGAGRPYDYSSNRRYLVAAFRGGGLAIWDTTQREPLRRLENSDRRYSQVTISDDTRWIAGVREDDAERIDLWRADNGRHVRWIRTARGPTGKLEFKNGNELHVTLADENGLVFSVPAGVVIGGVQVGNGTAAVKRPTATLRIEAPRVAAPTAPSTTKAFRPTPPPVNEGRREQIQTAPVAPSAPAVAAPAAESWATQAPSARMAAPQPKAAARIAQKTAPPAATTVAPSAVPFPVPFETHLPAAPSASMPSFESAAPHPAEPSLEAAAQSVPAAEPSLAPMTAAPSASAEPQAESEPADAAPDDAAFESATAAPDEAIAETAAPEADVAPSEIDTPDPNASTQQFHYEMRAEETAESMAPPVPEAHTLDEPPTPTTVDIHYATNRNRLAPKDREYLVYFKGFFGSLPAFAIYGLVILAALVLPWFGKRSWALSAVLVGSALLCAMGLVEAYVRSQLRDEMSGELYGCRPTELSYGKCTISVPPPQNRNPGDLNRPLSVWVFEAPENSDEHFLLKNVEEHADKDAFYRSLSAQLDKTDTRAALLFVHGYNVSFEDAIFRTAQLTVDLKFPGATMAFCWPSYADPVKYTFDEQNAEVSIPALHEVLEDLATRSSAKRVHIIAHSMGNRALAGALKSMPPSVQERNKSVFRELVLAAPDVDSRVFQSQVLPYIVNNTGHCTLYASSRDRALLMSRVFHNYQRLGETEPELIVAKGLDTIDASLVDTSLLGHSYIGDVQSIVSDLHDLVVQGKRATDRLGLELLQRQALHYWLIKPEVQAASDKSFRR